MNPIHIIPDVGIESQVLAYASDGIPVFPLVPGGKMPLTSHGFKDATRDEQTLWDWWTQWPTANVGMPTGAVSGLVVVDVDPRHGGTLDALWSVCGGVVKTRIIATGGGGWHVYFRWRPGLTNSAKGLPQGIDVRGTGGYVVLPPSVHESGNRYAVEVDAPIADVPSALYALLTATSRTSTRTGTWLERAIARVEQGDGRNDTGLWLACQLRDARLNEEEAMRIMEDYMVSVTELQDDPYTIDEARASLVQAYSRQPRELARILPALEGDNLTDVGNADRFAAMYGYCLKHVTGWGWVAFDGKRWVRGAEKQAQEMAKTCLRDMVTQAQGKNIERDVLAHVHASMSAYRIKSMLALASSDARMSASVDDFDTKSDLFNAKNGTIDLRTGRLRPHEAGDLITHISPVDYDPDATSPRFLRFLDEVFPNDPELVAYLQKFAGYSATGSVQEEKYLYASGSGANGKGVLFRALAYVFGDYAESISADVLTKSKYSNGGERTTPAFHKLPGKRFVFAQEPSGDSLDEDKLKQMCSADLVNVNPKNMPAYTFQPTHVLWLAANKRLTIDDTSNATWRRTVPIDFNESFSGREDWTLETMLGAEAAGILAWVVRGAVQWYAEGLGRLPQAIEETKKEYRADQDPASTFFDEELTKDPEASMPLEDATAAYGRWQSHTAWAPDIAGSTRRFAKLARDHGCRIDKTNSRQVLRGYRTK